MHLMRKTIFALVIIITLVLTAFLFLEVTRKGRLNAEGTRRNGEYFAAWEARTTDAIAALQQFKSSNGRLPKSKAELLDFDEKYVALFEVIPYQAREIQIRFDLLDSPDPVLVMPEPGYIYEGYYGYFKATKSEVRYGNLFPFGVFSDLSSDFYDRELVAEK